MNAERELAKMLEGWPLASARVETAPGDNCLTSEKIAAFVDDGLERSERRRCALHLSQCSFCAREVGALFRAARDFDDRVRVKRALGGQAARIGACLRVFVEEARGAFTRADGLLQGLTAPIRLNPVLAPAAYGFGGVRGEAEAIGVNGAMPPHAVQEATIEAEELPGVELLCGEEDGGSVTVSLSEPWEVYVVAPDGSTRALEIERGGDRFYATINGMPPGGYLLAFLRPNPPAA
jgi:hypothetical protein